MMKAKTRMFLLVPTLLATLFGGSLTIDNARMRKETKMIEISKVEASRGSRLAITRAFEEEPSDIENIAASISGLLYKGEQWQRNKPHQYRMLKGRIEILRSANVTTDELHYIDRLLNDIEIFTSTYHERVGDLFKEVGRIIIDAKSIDHLDALLDLIYSRRIEFHDSKELVAYASKSSDNYFVSIILQKLIEREKQNPGRRDLIAETGGWRAIYLIAEQMRSPYSSCMPGVKASDAISCTPDLVKAAKTLEQKRWVYRYLKGFFAGWEGKCDLRSSYLWDVKGLMDELKIPYCDIKRVLESCRNVTYVKDPFALACW